MTKLNSYESIEDILENRVQRIANRVQRRREKPVVIACQACLFWAAGRYEKFSVYHNIMAKGKYLCNYNPIKHVLIL